LFSLCLIFSANINILTKTNIIPLFKWFLGQISLFQFYTPDVLRFWGVGAPNGSLWTITVELQFYFLVPFLFKAINNSRKKNVLLILFLLIALVLNMINFLLDPDSLEAKLYTVTVLPYLFFFLLGIFTYTNWSYLKRFFDGQFLWWAISFIIFIYLTGYLFLVDYQEYFIHSINGFLATILLLGLVFSAGFTNPSLSKNLLKGNDISYGVYIYHMLIVNFFCHYGSKDRLFDLIISLGITITIASISWLIIEKPALGLKKNK
jgi:peptidoglycan/LPS O-acetylase OafA/YrhL